MPSPQQQQLLQQAVVAGAHASPQFSAAQVAQSIVSNDPVSRATDDKQGHIPSLSCLINDRFDTVVYRRTWQARYRKLSKLSKHSSHEWQGMWWQNILITKKHRYLDGWTKQVPSDSGTIG